MNNNSKSFKPNLNQYTNFFNQIKDDVVTSDNNMNAMFFMLIPEEISSQSYRTRVFHMQSLANACAQFDEDFICTFYSFSEKFDFQRQKKQFDEALKNPHLTGYARKLNELYDTIFENIMTDDFGIRRKVYLMAITSHLSPAKIRSFFDRIKSQIINAGLIPMKADEKIIKSLFNKIFVQPEENQDINVKNTTMEFNARSFFTSKYHVDGSLYYKKRSQILSVLAMPKTAVSANWLAPLFNINDVVVSCQFQTLVQKKRDMLIESLETDFNSTRQGKRRVQKEALAYQKEVLGGLLRDLGSGAQDVKVAKIMILCTGETRKELRMKTAEVRKCITHLGCQYNDINFRQLEAFRAFQPFDVSTIDKDIEVILQTDALGLAYPFTQSTYVDDGGYFLGMSVEGSPILWDQTDRRDKPTGNVVLFGSPGAGKSTMLKCSILGNFRNKRIKQTLVIDFEQEYTNLSDNFEQSTIVFSKTPQKDSPTINILQFTKEISIMDVAEADRKDVVLASPKERYTEGGEFVMGFLKMVLTQPNDPFTSKDIAILELELSNLYKKFGISPDKEFSGLANDRWPTLDDYLECFLERLGEIKKKIKGASAPLALKDLEIYTNLARLLAPYCKGGLYDGVLNKHTNIELDENAQLIVFNLFGLTGQNQRLQRAMIAAVMRFWYNTMVDHRKKYPKENDHLALHKCFICDEFHLMVDEESPELLKTFSELYARMRKYYCDIIIATQSPETMLYAENTIIKKAASTIMQNSTTRVILGMSEQTVKILNEKFFINNPLSEEEIDFITQESNLDRLRFVMMTGRKRVSGRLFSGDDVTGRMNVPLDQITDLVQLWGKNPDRIKG
ncbi:MAG: hypothetical protein LBT17_01025 [Mycoplasmataceae bacterium]|jgi:hypothetical protein|nr:hypothetical protein [Mycoplasmataceae bacterium]